MDFERMLCGYNAIEGIKYENDLPDEDDNREEYYPDEYDFYGIKRPEERDEWDDLWADRAREVGATLF